MKKILFLTSSYDNRTGGTTYDKYFIDRMKSNINLSIDVIEDRDFEEDKTDWKSFSKIYEGHVDKFKGYDILITNSRLYTRLYHFINKIKHFFNKMICFHHHYNFMTQTGYKKLCHKILETRFLKKFNVVIHASPYVKDLSKKYIGDERSQLFQLTSFSKKIYMHYEKYDNEKKDLLFMGNICKRKGLHLLIDAVNQLNIAKFNNFSLVLAGDYEDDKEYYQELKSNIDKYKLNSIVKFIGRVDGEKKDMAFRKAGIFVFPSLHEGYGIVLLEAQEYGLPIICFNNSAMPYTVKSNENGILVDDCNVKELSNSIKLMLSNDSLREKLSKNALLRSKNSYTQEELDSRIDCFAESLCE